MVGKSSTIFFVSIYDKGYSMEELIKMIREELNELLDINHGGTYFPPGLDPKVMKLFEKHKKKKNEETLGKN